MARKRASVTGNGAGTTLAPRQYTINGQPVTREQHARYQHFLKAAVHEIAHNVTTMRQEWLQRGAHKGDPRRNLPKECGYSETPDETELYDLCEVEPLADRISAVWAEECWQTYPDVYESEKEDKETPFEEALKELDSSLVGTPNHFSGEDLPNLCEVMARADRLSGKSRYSIILIGLNDGRNLSEPVRGMIEQGSIPSKRISRKGESEVNGDGIDPERMRAKDDGTYSYSLNINARETAKNKVAYLTVYPERLARIIRIETNRASPRYGLPTSYAIDVQDITTHQSETTSAGTIVPTTSREQEVHWTRVVHVIDYVESSRVYGRNRLRVPYRRIKDVEKLYAGSAEMYWLGAFGGIAFEAHQDLIGADYDKDAMKDEIELYMNGLSRFMRLIGVQAKSLAPGVVDPTPQIEAHLQAICIYLRMPKRIFMGSERGELASTQDDAAWNDRVKQRQMYHCVPRIIVPLVNHLINIGALPTPKDRLKVDWPDITSQTDEQRANIASVRAKTMQTYTSGGLNAIMSPLDFLIKELHFPADEAEKILEEAKTALEEAQELEKQQMEDDIARGLAPDPTKPAEVPPGKGPPPGKDGQANTPQMDRAGKLGAIDRKLGGLLANRAEHWCVTHNGWFSECPRDDAGRCESGGGGSSGGASEAKEGEQKGGGLFGRIKGALGLGPKDKGNTEGQGEFKSPEDSKTLKNIISGAESHVLHSKTASSHEDTALTNIMREVGKDGKPTVASKEEIDKLGAKGWYVMHRGVGDKRHVEQFKSGDDMYNGSGSFGNGTYFAYGDEKKAKATAEFYAGNNNEGKGGATMRVAFPPGAKIGKYETVMAERNAANKKLDADLKSGKIDEKTWKKTREVYDDLGRYAALHNYDAIDERTNKFMVVLNRKKCVMEG